MDVKKFVRMRELSDFPVGLGKSRNFDSCRDVFVFDDGNEPEQIVSFEGELVRVHHASLSETGSKKLLQYDNLQVVQDESWDLHMLLSKISERRDSLFRDSAKNSLIESMFCCQKTRDGISSSDVFAPCWQKCASYHLADAVSSLNLQRSGPSDMLDRLRKLTKSPVNEHISVVTQTVGIERATPVLLERMAKSTAGFSDLVEKNGHSRIIQKNHSSFVKDSMLSDCYFYLGYVNRENFVKIRDSLGREQDLIHVLRIAFDIEADQNLLSQQAELVQKSCRSLLDLVSEGPSSLVY